MLYLIVRKYKTEYSEDYRIEKWAKTVKEANQFLSALSLLEDNENTMFFIVPAQENPALILTEEVKKENGASEEIFF
tara:strand:+ start:27 stop:257 length:231 start_codon:yes stop_codon:yes gene_type:complete